MTNRRPTTTEEVEACRAAGLTEIPAAETETGWPEFVDANRVRIEVHLNDGTVEVHTPGDAPDDLAHWAPGIVDGLKFVYDNPGRSAVRVVHYPAASIRKFEVHRPVKP